METINAAEEQVKNPPDRFNQLMAKLHEEISEKLPKSMQFIRFSPLKKHFGEYAAVAVQYDRLQSQDDYFVRLLQAHGLKLGTKKMSFVKYKGHTEAVSLFNAHNSRDFIKVLISIDPKLGMVINVKLYDARSVDVPTPQGEHGGVYDAHDIREQSMRIYRCLSGTYVSSKILLKARADDEKMQKHYMSFDQLEQDLQKQDLLMSFRDLIWGLVMALTKDQGEAVKSFAYEKVI